MDLNRQLARLRDILIRHTPLLISYSGGVDSALLAVIARTTPGVKVRGVILNGSHLAADDLQEAVALAQAHAFPIEILPFEPLDPPVREENPPDRCRVCKLRASAILADAARRHGCRFIADGVNTSDLAEHRPGIQASSSCGIIHPFIMAGISKEGIREIARQMGLPFWNRPSSACLFSRIPYGEPITDQAVRQVEAAERFMRQAGFSQVRVRHHGTIARIEVPQDDIPRLLRDAAGILSGIREAGYVYVTVDLQGYRSGSMDEVLPEESGPARSPGE